MATDNPIRHGMVLVGGFQRSRFFPVEVEEITESVGRIACRECKGAGTIAFEPGSASVPCTVCKGAGWVFIGI
jgi:hypothetical protein